MPVCTVHIMSIKMQYVLTRPVSVPQIALSSGYLNFSQSPDQTRQVTNELFAPLGRVTGCPRTVFFVGSEQPARALGPREGWGHGLEQGSGSRPGSLGSTWKTFWGGGITVGRRMPAGQKSDSYIVGFGTRYIWDYLLMQHYFYSTLVRPGSILNYNE